MEGIRHAALRGVVVAVAVASVTVAAGDGRRVATCDDPGDCARDARATAAAQYRMSLYLDSRDVGQLSAILEAVRERHARSRMSDQELHAEAKRWGTAYGEIVRSSYVACWGPSRESKRLGAQVLFMDCRPDWEWDVIGLVEGLIARPLPVLGLPDGPRPMTIEQVLILSMLD